MLPGGKSRSVRETSGHCDADCQTRQLNVGNHGSDVRRDSLLNRDETAGNGEEEQYNRTRSATVPERPLTKDLRGLQVSYDQ